LKTFYLIFIFLFFSFSQLSAESIINNKSGGPLFLFLVDKNCQPNPDMLKKLMFSMPTDPEFYLSISCKKLGKTIELEPSKKLSITDHNEFVVIGKLKSPVSKVSFCYLKNSSEINIEALGIGGVICKCKSKDNCNDQLLK
jgi:hypothetical protein|tara:strand:- start:158 stop:580 length:423 start_codon:yes stop_codon:yes gene_type:complete